MTILVLTKKTWELISSHVAEILWEECGLNKTKLKSGAFGILLLCKKRELGVFCAKTQFAVLNKKV